MSGTNNKRKRFSVGNVWNKLFDSGTTESVYVGGGSGGTSFSLTSLGNGAPVYNGSDGIKSISSGTGIIVHNNDEEIVIEATGDIDINNLGTGVQLFNHTQRGVKSLTGTNGLDITATTTDVTATINPAFLTSTGTGVAVYDGTMGVKTLVAGSDISLTPAGGSITIDYTGPGATTVNFYVASVVQPTTGEGINLSDGTMMWYCPFRNFKTARFSEGSNITLDDGTTGTFTLAANHAYRVRFDVGAFTSEGNLDTHVFGLVTSSTIPMDLMDTTFTKNNVSPYSFQCIYSPAASTWDGASGGPCEAIIRTYGGPLSLAVASLKHQRGTTLSAPVFGSNTDFPFKAASIIIEQIK